MKKLGTDLQFLDYVSICGNRLPWQPKYSYDWREYQGICRVAMVTKATEVSPLWAIKLNPSSRQPSMGHPFYKILLQFLASWFCNFFSMCAKAMSRKCQNRLSWTFFCSLKQSAQTNHQSRYQEQLEDLEKEQRRKCRVEKKIQELNVEKQERIVEQAEEQYHDIVEFAQNYFNSHEKFVDGRCD